MATDTRLVIGPDGQLTLPPAVLDHYGLLPDASVRIVETRSGILLVPDRNARTEEALAEELAGWQCLFEEATGMFEYDETSMHEDDGKASYRGALWCWPSR